MAITEHTKDVLKRHKIKLSDLAQKYGVSRQAMYKAAEGEGSGLQQLRVAIALEIGLCPSSIWEYKSETNKKRDDSLYFFEVFSSGTVTLTLVEQIKRGLVA